MSLLKVKPEGVAKCENPPVRTLKIDHYYILPQWLISSPLSITIL